MNRIPFTPCSVYYQQKSSLPLHPVSRPASLLLLGLSAALFMATPALAENATHAPKAIAKGSSISYIIQKGDTLAKVCAKYKLNSENCQQTSFFNALENNKLPATGSVLHIPLDVLSSSPEQVRLIQTTGLVKINGKTVSAGARFSENARITADADGSAVLEMADGSQVQVLPNSVAEIVRSRNYSAPDSNASGKVISWVGSKIRLLQGMLETKAQKSQKQIPGKPIEVETTTSMIGVRGTRFRVAAADKHTPFDRAEVLEGSVSNINTWKNSEIALNAGQGAVVNPNKAEMQAVALLPAPAVPAKGQVLRRPDAFWQFSPVAGAVAYRVIAASDEAFQIVSYSEKTATPVADLSRLPSYGIWHVRARAVDSNGLEGFDASSTINLREPVWLWHNPSIYSRNGQQFLMWTDVTDSKLKSLANNASLKLEFSSSNDFANPIVATAALNSNQAKEQKLPALPYGTYYLRVSLVSDAIKNDEAQVFAFDLSASSLKGSNYHTLLNPVRSQP
ncbi:MAG: FecR domain-containing protein [Brachymonas sp.]|nr:FecR domain-containing protein [Brachymonas sp.]MBP7744006.1 FecR domain-containing protein [Brachymonas sp.]MBP8746480.1 FecR domain-containing protein [Brachymonas sp.]